jgi:hypothetical protein
MLIIPALQDRTELHFLPRAFQKLVAVALQFVQHVAARSNRKRCSSTCFQLCDLRTLVKEAVDQARRSEGDIILGNTKPFS